MNLSIALKISNADCFPLTPDLFTARTRRVFFPHPSLNSPPNPLSCPAIEGEQAGWSCGHPLSFQERGPRGELIKLNTSLKLLERHAIIKHKKAIMGNAFLLVCNDLLKT